MNKKIVFAAAAGALAAAFVLGASLYRGKRAEELGFLARESAERFVRPHSPKLGSEDAKVFLVEFTDPACETCAAFAPFVKGMMDAAPGKIRLVMRYAPFHAGSEEVVRVLHAAHLQGRFWETLDLLFKKQGEWTRHHQVLPEKVWEIVPEAGLDMERLRADIDDPRVVEAVRKDVEDLNALGVRKTPGFFVNGRPLEPFGARPLADLVEAELRASYPDWRPGS